MCVCVSDWVCVSELVCVCLGVCESEYVCVCVCVCDLENQQRGGLGPKWAVEPQKIKIIR